MIPPDVFLADYIQPGLRELERLGGPLPSRQAELFMLAIAQQESGPNLNARYQHSPRPVAGPARGWWQFETAGVEGVLAHRASRTLALAACELYVVVPQAAPVHRALEGHDMLACMIARLLIWTDPAPLPTTWQDGWRYYMRTWRPGRPHENRWPGHWDTATRTVEHGELSEVR